MTSFNELYHRLVKASVEKKEPQELEKIRQEEFDPHQLDCLLPVPGNAYLMHFTRLLTEI